MVGMLTGAFVYSAVMIAVDGLSGFRPIPAIIAGTLVGGVIGFLFAGSATHDESELTHFNVEGKDLVVVTGVTELGG